MLTDKASCSLGNAGKKNMCGSPRPGSGWMLLGSSGHTYYPLRLTSFPSRSEAKCVTMKLAVYLAKEVAAILRAVLTQETKKLYNDSTVHLLCSNYWVQPIYQELLHSSSRYNATREGERKRPSSGLARVAQTTQTAEAIGFWH